MIIMIVILMIILMIIMANDDFNYFFLCVFVLNKFDFNFSFFQNSSIIKDSVNASLYNRCIPGISRRNINASSATIPVGFSPFAVADVPADVADVVAAPSVHKIKNAAPETPLGYYFGEKGAKHSMIHRMFYINLVILILLYDVAQAMVDI